MKTNRLAKIMSIGLLAVLLLPTLTQAQNWEAAEKAVVKVVKEADGTFKYTQKIGTATPTAKNATELSGKINKAVAEGARAAQAGVEIGKTIQTTGISGMKGATTASKAARQAQEGISGFRQPQAPKVKTPTTTYYSMPNKAEEVPSLTQKVPETISKEGVQETVKEVAPLENTTAAEGLSSQNVSEEIHAPADFSDKEAVKAWLRKLAQRAREEEAAERAVQQAGKNESLEARLITDETNPKIKKILQRLSKDLEMSQGLADSAAMQKRLQDARAYFHSLTPQQANDVRTLYSAPFRQHAIAIRSPQATQYGYFLQGSGMEGNYEYILKEELGGIGLEESGYIPTVIGNPAAGISKRQLLEMIHSAEKTDKPIFVFFEMHGGVPGGKFVALANSRLNLDTTDIVEYMRKLRVATGTPELNLYMTSCHGGAFLDEFEALPLGQREGINVFVSTSAQQCNFSSNTRYARTHIEGKDIVKEMVEDMVRQIMQGGNYYVQANINGQSFNPLQIAMERARAIGDNELFESLEIESRFQKEKKSGASAFFKLFDKGFFADEMKQYFIGYATKEKADALFGKTIEDDAFDFLEEMLKRNFSDQYGFDFNSEMMQWNKKFKINRPDRSLEEYEQSIWDDIDF